MADWAASSSYSNDDLSIHRLFDEVYAELQPSADDRNARENVIRYLNSCLARSMNGASLTAFGSYRMEMYNWNSDLDLSLNVNGSNTKHEKLVYLKNFTKIVRKLRNNFDTVQPIYRASVPVVKFQDRFSQLKCDVSVDNTDGVFKSSFLGSLAHIDPRFRQLCFLLKQWYKAHGLNDSSSGGLSSYCLILLATVHLQTCGILPPLSSFLPGFVGDLQVHIQYVEQQAKQHGDAKYGAKNTQSVVELFRGFFDMMQNMKDYWKQGYCASAYEGGFVSHSSWCNSILVEDFVDRSQNVGRTLSNRGFDMLYTAIAYTRSLLTNPTSNLKVQLFGLGQTRHNYNHNQAFNQPGGYPNQFGGYSQAPLYYNPQPQQHYPPVSDPNS